MFITKSVNTRCTHAQRPRARRGAVGVVYEHTRVQFSALAQSGSAHAHSAIIPNCAEPEALNCMASFSFGCDAAPLF